MLQVISPPQIPSKYDIVPVHASDVAAYMRCRRYWDWSSPARNNLRRKIQIYGINTNLWFGTGIHYALQHYYDPVLKRDPVETWTTWFQIQWEGGEVHQEDLEELSPDVNPIALPDRPYMLKVRGLRDLLPDVDHEQFDELRRLGIGMMDFYKKYAEKNDDFVVIAAESQFSVPLGFEVKDIREESPNYGKKLEVHARGKRDAIIFKYEVEKFYLMDHKTAGKIDDRYFSKLDMDPQCTQYIWACQQEAEIHDLPYKQLDGLLYQALRKVYPKPPTPTRKGLPSINRQEESTTAEMFRAYILGENPERMNLEVWFNTNESAQNYYTWLVELGDKNFIQRDWARRNQHEIKHFGQHLKEVAKEMLNPKTAIYPHPTSDYLCLNCQFRGPCLAANDGSDWKGMLVDGYEQNVGR